MELKMTQLRMHVNKARSQQVFWSETVKDFLANEFVNLRKRYKCLVNFNTLQSLILISESLCKLCPHGSLKRMMYWHVPQIPSILIIANLQLHL